MGNNNDQLFQIMTFNVGGFNQEEGHQLIGDMLEEELLQGLSV